MVMDVLSEFIPEEDRIGLPPRQISTNIYKKEGKRVADLNHAEISGDMKQLTAGMKEATKAAAALNREISSLNQLLKRQTRGI